MPPAAGTIDGGATLSAGGEALKKIAVVFCLAPVIAMAQNLPWTPESATTCFAGKNTKAEVLEAIACLGANPAAGSAVASQFKHEQAGLISTDADVGAAFSDLERQKNKRLYVRMQRADGGPARLMVVESASVGGPAPSIAYDLSALDLTFTHTSTIFGADKTVPLPKVTSFLYVSKGQGIGELKTGFRDGAYSTDTKYQSGYPIKSSEKGSQSVGIQELAGTVYPGKSLNEHWKFDTGSLSGYIVTFILEDQGRGIVEKFEDEIATRQKVKEQIDRTAAEQRRIELERDEERKSKALSEMGKARIGSEDSCRRLGFAAVSDSDFVDVECQFAGKLNLTDLRNVGWLVVNKTRDSNNVVREYFIRKVR